MRIKIRFKKHFLKVLSVILSVLLWVYVLNSERISFEKNFTLQYILPHGMVLLQRPVQEISVLINGPKAFVRNFLNRKDVIEIDLNKFNYQTDTGFLVDLATIPVDLPSGMVIEKIVPRKLNIRLDNKVTKEVPLRLSSLNEADLSTNVKISPERVEISGPKFLMDELEYIILRPIDLDLLTQQKVLGVEIFLPDERMFQESTEKIFVMTSSEKKQSKFIFNKHPIKFLTKIKKYTPSIKEVTVKVVTKNNSKSRSNISSSLEVWAEIPEKIKGQVKVPLRFIKPSYIESVELIPKSIIVNIE